MLNFLLVGEVIELFLNTGDLLAECCDRVHEGKVPATGVFAELWPAGVLALVPASGELLADVFRVGSDGSDEGCDEIDSSLGHFWIEG
ncbi:hypothetical protein [Corynebacterium auriscanis]|uniref:hypothetical protein n=1 Tax=Corynebacterium auriscanis TaxID=99807 RepID=UPI0024AD5067|nr:hypothetical protein [Corynebacterium auriscanis]